jgi:hypothetical protein
MRKHTDVKLDKPTRKSHITIKMCIFLTYNAHVIGW